jgi:hypothetical protein
MQSKSTKTEFKKRKKSTETAALFIRLIIRTFQLVFLAETVFFSHNKSANSIFQSAYQHSRTEPAWACFSKILNKKA